MLAHARPRTPAARIAFFGIIIGAVLTLPVAAVAMSPSASALAGLDPIQVAQAQLSNCQLLAAHSTGTQHTRAQQCVTDQQRILQLLVPVTPSTTSPVATTPPVTPSPTATPSPSPTVTPTPTPTTTPPPSGFPDASTTGVPDGTALTAYTGPCTITTAGTVIDAKTITCAQLVIRASGVRVTRSQITGTADPAVSVSGGDLAISDSTISAATNTTGLGDNNWTGLRLDVSGGNRGLNCDNHCTLTDSWVHGNRVSGTTHASGLRAGQFTTAVHNRLDCDAPADNCSADLTGYPDFAPTHDWTITGNLFVATHAGGSYFCAYGGDSGGKPFSNDPANAVNIQFRDNTFGRGAFGRCGGYSDSSPFADYDKTKPGFVFNNAGNRYDDGEAINA